MSACQSKTKWALRKALGEKGGSDASLGIGGGLKRHSSSVTAGGDRHWPTRFSILRHLGGDGIRKTIDLVDSVLSIQEACQLCNLPKPPPEQRLKTTLTIGLNFGAKLWGLRIEILAHAPKI